MDRLNVSMDVLRRLAKEADDPDRVVLAETPRFWRLASRFILKLHEDDAERPSKAGTELAGSRVRALEDPWPLGDARRTLPICTGRWSATEWVRRFSGAGTQTLRRAAGHCSKPNSVVIAESSSEARGQLVRASGNWEQRTLKGSPGLYGLGRRCDPLLSRAASSGPAHKRREPSLADARKKLEK